MKKIINNIEKNIEREVNLPAYAEEMTKLYYRNSCVRMMMNYYTFKEILNESDGKNEKIKELSDSLTVIIKDFIEGNGNSDKSFEELSCVRNENINIVNALTAYTDIFSVYEHVLNRVEYKFAENAEEKEEELSGITDEDITRSVMQYILSERDNMVINGKIGMVVRELPVRMTKGRFFEYISEGLKVYKGQEKRSLEDFIFMIKSSAAVDLPKNLYDYFENLNDVYKEFVNTSFKDITKDQYDNLKNGLEYATEFLEDTVSVHMMLQENINDLFILLMGNQYMLSSPKEFDDLKCIVAIIDELYSDEVLDEMDERINDIFSSIEGVQENIGMKLSKYEYVIDMVNSDLREITDSIMISNRFDLLLKMRDLSSGSMFVEFDKEYDTSEADMDYVQSETDKLIKIFTESFENNEKLLNRARMAITLSTLPVFFNNISEIQDYLYTALSQCRDEAEKLASKELLLSLVNEY